VNPFGSPHGSIASLEGKPRTPPSPHTLVLSARHPSAQPRRPSQLRNMQRGSVDSDTLDSAALQPLAPAWAQTQTPGPTLFNDPFESGGKAALGSKATADASQTAGSVAGVLAGAAAWAAPESWGVEADEEDGGTTSSDEDDWKPREEELPSPPPSDTRLLQPSLSSTARKPPPFGFKSAGRDGGTDSRPGTGSGRKRVKTSSGRPGSRPPTATRPGTSGSAHVSTVPVSFRFDLADSSITYASTARMARTRPWSSP
jgi:adenylate cyclase